MLFSAAEDDAGGVALGISQLLHSTIAFCINLAAAVDKPEVFSDDDVIIVPTGGGSFFSFTTVVVALLTFGVLVVLSEEDLGAVLV